MCDGDDWSRRKVGGATHLRLFPRPFLLCAPVMQMKQQRKLRKRDLKKKEKQTQCNMKKEPLFFLPKRSACKVKKKKKSYL